jgi:rod shape-determining protein MreC
MAFAGGGMNSSSARDSAPGGKFFFFAILSIVLMYFDQRDGWGERIRYGLQAVAYPIQVTVGSPARLWKASTEMFRTRADLREENTALLARQQELDLRAMRYEALEHENARLRGLTGALPPLVQKSQLANVVNADLGLVRQRMVIDKGETSGLFRSQAIVDATGLIGQLARVGPWSAEVMLISDPAAAVPVEVVRSGERSIAVGTGDSKELQLPYLPATADVKAGDLLVTSGLGGIFPAGIPVGEVIENRRDPDDLLAHVRVKPRALLDSGRHVLALWFDPANPSAPVRKELLETLPEAAVADPVVTGQPAAAKPPAAAPAAASKPAAATTSTRPAAPGPRPAQRPAVRSTAPATTPPAPAGPPAAGDAAAPAEAPTPPPATGEPQ